MYATIGVKLLTFTNMVNDTTLHTGNNAHQTPDHVKQVASMVRALSNKYIPVPLLEEVKIDLLQSLKDFCHRARKRAAAVNLCEMRTNIPNHKANQHKEPPHQTR
jgi:hypothetical protein